MKTPKKVNLAGIPTPIEVVKYQNRKFLIKRDDLTGCELSGNKVRKLEYIIADAIRNKADIIFTCGGEQSNHARATTIAAKKFGMPVRLFLWGSDRKIPTGNLFLNKMYGAEILFLNKSEYEKVNDIMQYQREKLLRKNLNAFVIPEGGSTANGIFGYFSFVMELMGQIDLKKIKGIVSASGSGGTSAGMLAAVSYLNLDIQIIAVNVLYSKEVITKKILTLAEAINLEYDLNTRIKSENLIVLDGYSDEGYKSISEDKIKLIRNFAVETGILFDPAYTGKAFVAYYENYLSRNLGMKYIFVHTGGIFGIFGREKEYLI
ncbi:MAG: pyridoxal-phosphate dependent enzyme [Ignavibacterium album]|uniref:1-aminocyclopropane-1-carboxylate deaminase/D-cysteine desulfhydrase n=1 Tax=Ignavibacterium album TaxID=591197 RepID=UPI0026E9B63E|nr:pyridoxal-phosphate dependent enzyme [Ignavibacterium album]MBI5663197.1 pyridoxal-phosphate dependent enzyme [Ignavibacterium album]